MKWGLFGGTFDPVHFGHLRCAQDILEALALDRICFVPAFRPPLKHRTDLTSFENRFEMVRLAIADNPAFEVSEIEARRNGVSYSIDTVREFIHEKQTEPYFIFGQDAFAEIQKWKGWEEFLTLCHFVVMTRPGYAAAQLEPALPSSLAARFRFDSNEDAYVGPTGTSIRFCRVTFLDISSTDIRQRIKGGKSVRYLLPASVLHYVLDENLYR